MVSQVRRHATMAAVVGAELKPTDAMDSWSFLPLLRGDEGFSSRQQVLLQSGSKNELIYRDGPWKLIIQSNNKLTKFEPVALFNLAENPDELKSWVRCTSPFFAPYLMSFLSPFFTQRMPGFEPPQ